MNKPIKSICLSLLTISTLHPGNESPITLPHAMIIGAISLGYYVYTLASEDISHINEYRRIRGEIEQIPGVRIKDHKMYLFDYNNSNTYRPRLKFEGLTESERIAIREKWDTALEQYDLKDKNNRSWKGQAAFWGAILLGYFGYQLLPENKNS